MMTKEHNQQSRVCRFTIFLPSMDGFCVPTYFENNPKQQFVKPIFCSRLSYDRVYHSFNYVDSPLALNSCSHDCCNSGRRMNEWMEKNINVLRRGSIKHCEKKCSSLELRCL